MQVGHSYGRRMVSGLLRAHGWRIGENRIGESLRRVHPNHCYLRRMEANRNLNPHPYVANYFGHKIHIDQNEKLAMFGCTHVLGVDGYSGKIVSLVTMPIKNCSLIYEHVFM